jgi:hypothetical protein
VAVASRRYGAAHPDQNPHSETEEGSEHPRLALTAEADLLASHGPYLTFEVRTTREVGGDVERSSTRRGVLDLRTGRRVAVADLVGRDNAPAVAAEGRRRFRAALDSARAAQDERARLARRALAQFVFEPGSFGLADVQRAPAIVFLAPGEGDEAGGYTLPLEPIVIDPAPAWWTSLGPTFPASDSLGDGSAGARWKRTGADVEARYDSATSEYTLLLSAPRPTGARGEWPVGRVQGPLRQLYWLDVPPLDSASRRGLARAFDESALYSDEARTVRLQGRGAPDARRRSSVRSPVGSHRCQAARSRGPDRRACRAPRPAPRAPLGHGEPPTPLRGPFSRPVPSPPAGTNPRTSSHRRTRTSSVPRLAAPSSRWSTRWRRSPPSGTRARPV